MKSSIVKGLDGFNFPQLVGNSFNQYGGFNRLQSALAAIELHKGEMTYDLFAYAIPELIYEDGQPQVAEIGCVEPDTIEAGAFEKLGFDAVVLHDCSTGCSPLSCNGQAGLNIDLVNEFYLINSLDGAIELATEFSISKPEPGPYTIVEVWRYLPLL